MDQTRLTYLLKQYGKNESTPSEKDELQRFLNDGVGEALFSEVISNLMSNYTEEDFDKSPYAGLSRHVLEIDKGIHERPRGGTWRNMLRYWAAAAFIILLGAGIYWFLPPSRRHDAVVSNTSQAFSARLASLAIITFSDGTKIHLDKVKSGLVTETGSVRVIKAEDDNISYQVVGNGGIAEKQYHTITNPRGSKAVHIKLLDGSSIWLNAGSAISYPVPFAKAERKVELDGEAYFDVNKTPLKPFIVETSTLDVKVLGTAFNVRAYSNETSSQATLLRGAVEVMIKNKKNSKVLLEPNEKIVVQNKIALHSITPGDEGITDMVYELRNISVSKTDSTIAETEWTRNRLAFKQEKIENIIPVLERWFNVIIEVRRKMPESRLFSGDFENDSLKDVLESLKTIVGFNYTIEKDKVIIF